LKKDRRSALAPWRMGELPRHSRAFYFVNIQSLAERPT